MTKRETVAIVYRVIGAYPHHARHFTDEMIEDMIREWHEGLANLPPDGVMQAVTDLIKEQKWMPSLSEVINKILDIQYGTEDAIIRKLDVAIASSSSCIIFGQITEEQERGYERLTDFQKQIIRSPHEFNRWLTRDYEWKAERVRQIKREIQYGRYKGQLQNNFNVLKALEERRQERP